MERIVLIGDNISHSLSPRLHNYLFERFDLPYHYELMPLEEKQLAHAIEEMRISNYRGGNITSPYKQIVLSLLDDISEEADRIRAVNTIVIEQGKSIGYNTDADGFVQSLEECSIIAESFSAAMLGTGGAAMAATYSLLNMPNLQSLAIYSRERKRANDIAFRWNDDRVRGQSIDDFIAADLVVHATPMGLSGNPGQVLEEKQLSGIKLLYEMIYSPSETALMRTADRIGVKTVNGMKMFIHQALRAFYLWTGIEVKPSDIPENILSVENEG